MSEHAEESADCLPEQPDVHPALFWRDATVSITTAQGVRLVPALETPLVPGLAVTMAAFGTFDVTHLASGRKIAGPFRREANARLWLLAWASLADWTQDPQALNAEIARRTAENALVPVFGLRVNGAAAETLPYAEAFQILRGYIGSVDEFPWEGEESPEARADDAFDFLVAQRTELVAEIVNAAELVEKRANG